MNVNYTLSRTWAAIWADNATQTVNYRTIRDKNFDSQVSPFDVRHVLQAYGAYEPSHLEHAGLPAANEHSIHHVRAVDAAGEQCQSACGVPARHRGVLE